MSALQPECTCTIDMRTGIALDVEDGCPDHNAARTWRVTVTRNGGEIIGYQDVPYPRVQTVIDGWRPLAGTYGWTVAAQPLDPPVAEACRVYDEAMDLILRDIGGVA